METRVPIVKIDEGRRLFGGWAYVAKDSAGNVVTDHSDDVIDTDEAWQALEDALVQYALEIRKGDDMHEVYDAADLVELFIIDEQRREALGIPEGVLPMRAAFVTFKAADTEAGDALWQAIRNGERRMLSIVGIGEREEIT